MIELVAGIELSHVHKVQAVVITLFASMPNRFPKEL